MIALICNVPTSPRLRVSLCVRAPQLALGFSNGSTTSAGSCPSPPRRRRRHRALLAGGGGGSSSPEPGAVLAGFHGTAGVALAALGVVFASNAGRRALAWNLEGTGADANTAAGILLLLVVLAGT